MLTARPPKHDNDPFLRLQYKVRRSKLKPFAPLYHERLAEEEKATGTRKKRMPPLENSPTLPKLVSPRDLPTSTGMDEEMQVDAPDETVQLRGSVRSLQWLTRQWEHSTERYTMCCYSVWQILRLRLKFHFQFNKTYHVNFNSSIEFELETNQT